MLSFEEKNIISRLDPRTPNTVRKIGKVQLVSILAIVFILSVAHQVVGDADCYKEKQMVMRLCNDSIKIGGDYVPPTDLCRQYVSRVDMVCICHKLTSYDELVVSAIKLVHLAQDCHKPVPSRSKCGSKYLPLYKFIYI